MVSQTHIGILISLYMIILNIKGKYKEFTNTRTIDLTKINSSGVFTKLSPYYPHGDIPVPNTPHIYFKSVYEVWQNLCIRQNCKNNQLNIEDRKFRKGLFINEYWTLAEARRKILIPIYCWMLENKTFDIVKYLRRLCSKENITIIDNSINDDIDNIAEPLSCAFLLKAYIESSYPYQDAITKSVENIPVLVGHKLLNIRTEKSIAKKIASIYTGEQRIIDF